MNKKEVNINPDKLSDLEKFLFVLVEEDVDLCRKVSNGNPILDEYIDDAIKVSQDEKFLKEYNKELVEQEKRDSIYLEGKEKGMYIQQRRTAISMLQRKIDKKIVCECTNLHMEEIEIIIKIMNDKELLAKYNLL